MVIYGEYLFIENFIVGLLLLILTAKLTGKTAKKSRIIIGSVICGLSGFLIFVPLEGVMSGVVRLLAAAVCTVTVFGKRQWIRTTMLFMILTFLTGGAVVALLLWKQQPAISHQGIIYIDAVTYLRLLCLGILAFGLAYWFIKLVRKRNGDLTAKSDVRLVIEGIEYVFTAFADSGNGLVEPISGKPVILIDQGAATKIDMAEFSAKERCRVIPYRAVGVKDGYLEGFKIDTVIFGDCRIDGAYGAVYNGSFEGFEVLMHRDFLEGGLLQDA